jgi:carbon-monoxide dehydrogenase small subunit
MRNLNLNVNGRQWEGVTADSDTLLSVLRDKLGLTGAKANCLEGECGVCTVLLDGRPVCSCILLAAQCEGRSVTTIEGMAAGDVLHPLQQAFIDCGAVQCGFCIPGMVMTAAGLLAENPSPNREQIKEGLCGTLCRCTGYKKIIDAVESASKVEAAHGPV